MAPDEDDQPDVPVHCPACETTSEIPLADVAASVERHNEQLHDGEEIARVDPAIAEHVADIVADELDLLE